MKKMLDLALIGLLFLMFSSCVATNTTGNYPARDLNKKVSEKAQTNKMAEWKLLDKAYGPAEIEVFFVGNVKIKRYTYTVGNLTYRVLFYNDKIHNIVTDR